MKQLAASCTRGAPPVAQKLNRPPTPLGRDSLTYPLFAAMGKWVLLLLEEHIPKAGEKLKEGHSRKSRDLAKVRDEVKQATVLILVESVQ